MRLSRDQIAAAKTATSIKNARHEHDDCIRMAYEWLDAQKTTKGVRCDDWKHVIERWCGNHVTDDDVQVAAILHPRINGSYPNFNIAMSLTYPTFKRLWNVPLFTHFPDITIDEIKHEYAKME